MQKLMYSTNFKKCFSPPLNDSFVWSFLSFSENENLYIIANFLTLSIVFIWLTQLIPKLAALRELLKVIHAKQEMCFITTTLASRHFKL